MGCLQGDLCRLYFQPDDNCSLSPYCTTSIKDRRISKVSYNRLQCWDSHLPELDAAARYKAIFITGSHYSAYEDLLWIDKLVVWLRDFVLETEHGTKIVAVCFGCQVTMHALISVLTQPECAEPYRMPICLVVST